MKRLLLIPLLTVATGARAQYIDPECDAPLRPLAATPGTARATHSLLGTEALFGAAAALNGTILPSLSRRKRGEGDRFGFSFHIGDRYFNSVARVPVCNGSKGEYDLGSSAVAVGLKIFTSGDDALELFYSSGVSWSTYLFSDQDVVVQRLVRPLYTPLIAAFVPLGVLFNDGATRVGGIGGGSIFDIIVGASYELHILDVAIVPSAGWVASSGVFFNLSVAGYPILGAVVDPKVLGLRYGMLGIREFRVPTFESLQVSLFVSTFEQFVPPVQTDYGTGAYYLDRLDEGENLFTTYQVTQWQAHVRNILGFADVEVSLGTDPDVYLQSVIARFHGAELFRAELDDWLVGIDGRDLLSLSLGYVGVPDSRYLGQRRAHAFSVAAHFAFLFFRFNEPQMVARFPYSVNAWEVGIVVKR